MGTFRPQLGRCIDAAAYAIAATVAPALRWWILRRAALWDRRPSSFEPPQVAASSVQFPLGARGSVVSTGQMRAPRDQWTFRSSVAWAPAPGADAGWVLRPLLPRPPASPCSTSGHKTGCQLGCPRKFPRLKRRARRAGVLRRFACYTGRHARSGHPHLVGQRGERGPQ